jgi:hypothetical protein
MPIANYFFFVLALMLPGPLALAQREPGPYFSPDRAGVVQMLEYILSASPEEREALTRALRPTEEDCLLLFPGRIGRQVFQYQRRLKRQAHIIVRPLLADQTEYLLWEASTQDLLALEGEARHFPGGYHELARFIEPGYRFYRFKFVQPGRQIGSAYDVLVHVNGRWRLIHRPWTVLF